ncbi:MAG: hypothetical protein ACJZ59_08645 [Candidatus Thalassarchaeaceae archaeon]
MEKTNALLLSVLIFFMALSGSVTGLTLTNNDQTNYDDQLDAILNNTYTTEENYELYYSTFEITNINDTHHSILGTDQLNVGNFNTHAGYYYQIIELSYFVNDSSGDWKEMNEDYVRLHAFCGDFPAMESSSDQFNVLISEDCNVEIGVQDDFYLRNFEAFKDDYNDVYLQLVFQKFPMIDETN